MSIKQKIEELQAIEKELKTRQKHMSSLRKRAKELHASIDGYLESKGQSGMKYKGVAYIREKKVKRPLKKNKDQIRSGIDVLREYVDDPEKVYNELMASRRELPVENFRLKIEKC